MRCKNCGWENPDGLQNCEKCNGCLAQASSTPSSSHDGSDRMKSTVAEAAIFAGAPSEPLQNNCPKCGYPLSDNSTSCPNCNYDLQSAPAFQPAKIQRTGMGTVMGGPVGCSGSANRFCTLKPIAWEGEDVNYTPVTYVGDTIVLNRANTDANNNSITSREQAIITCEEGEWYIENKSDLKTTYVKVNGRVKLSSGDIIVLGNREFIFKG